MNTDEQDRGRIDHFGWVTLMTATAKRHPTNWQTMNIGALAGSMPAKVSEKVRAMVTAGLAKLVEEVKKYAPAM